MEKFPVLSARLDALEKKTGIKKVMAEDLIKVKKTTEEYELKKSDLVPETGDDAPTITNKIAGLLDKFRVIPRMVMLAYIFAFYKSVTWFMQFCLILQIHKRCIYQQ